MSKVTEQLDTQTNLPLTITLTLKRLFRNKILNVAIKIIVTLLLSWTIYEQVFAKDNSQDLWQSFLTHFSGSNIVWLAIVVALVPLNWGFEALKWRELIRNFSNYSFAHIYKAILAGITVSLFTPNRVGEYAGRVVMVEAKHNWKAVIATLVGSLSQLLVLLSLGLVGMLYFSTNYFEIETTFLALLVFFGVIGIGMMLFGFYNVDLFIPIARRIPFPEWIKRYLRHLIVLKKYSNRELSQTLTFSFFRYLTYSIQYYLILQFFGIEIGFLMGLAGISTIYLLQTSVPLPPVMGLLARSNIALQIWGFFSVNQADILAASFGLFIINLIIPALLGLVFIVQTNVMKSLGYEQENAKSTSKK